MPDVIADITLKAGGAYHPPGSTVRIPDAKEAADLVRRKRARWPKGGPKAPSASDQVPESEFPADFPARAELLAAGVLTFEALGAVKDLTEIKGIGKATAEKVAAAIPSNDGEDEGEDGDADQDEDGGPVEEPGEPGLDAVEA